MSANIDLRATYGWHLSKHARTNAAERGVSTRDVLETIAAPEITYTAYNYGPGREVYKRGELAVVGDPRNKTVITVLWNTDAEWTSEQFRDHRLRQSA